MEVNCCCVWSVAAVAGAYSDFCHYPAIGPPPPPPLPPSGAPYSSFLSGTNRDSPSYVLPATYYSQSSAHLQPQMLLLSGPPPPPPPPPASALAANPSSPQQHQHRPPPQMTAHYYPPAYFAPTLYGGHLSRQHHNQYPSTYYIASPGSPVAAAALRSHQQAYLTYEPTFLCHHPICHHELNAQMHHEPLQQQQQQQQPSPLDQQQTPPACNQSNKLNTYNLLAMLPIQAEPTRTRQAYGMDKVWQDEFEQLFSQFVSNILWTLAEVETNPNITDSTSILGYRGHYQVRASCEPRISQERTDIRLESVSRESNTNTADNITSGEKFNQILAVDETEEPEESVGSDKSDCDSGLNSATSADDCEPISTSTEELRRGSGCDERSTADRNEPLEVSSGSGKEEDEEEQEQEQPEAEEEADSGHNSSASSFELVVHEGGSCLSEHVELLDGQPEANKETNKSVCGEQAKGKHPTKFRMFIDSAKVRFCCDNCGHGWTSMKGRVVFWYELFELVPEESILSEKENLEEPDGDENNQIIGYCAYKLFGQQCDICKIENRFERPMWYPEEVCKVLNNLYNKIGQIYFGFKMPAIDKQRRAGKPKTSHNSSLCQACHDGVCTDRK